ncbi:MaoC family dehydratase [Indioceanicola profundi]|uniref:MaoC family dehydratase n=1 Tax=Indioceanicola profundi TaxID=2220096 RepID=UPI000E6AB588|nr:MaoC family dehydratase [Indioceanicola profundi]
MPGPVRYLEDMTAGETIEVGSYTVSEEEILDFARRYDPQPFHLDAEAGKTTHFGGLVASGWHTAGIMMRMMVDEILSPETSLGSPGIDELRWLKPVRPGDTLRLRFTTLEVRRSRSRPEMGTVRQRMEVLNQYDEVVMSMLGIGMVRARTLPEGGSP